MRSAGSEQAHSHDEIFFRRLLPQRGETRVAQARLAVEYVDGNTASYTAIFYSRDHDMWGGKADEGIIDTLDQESAIVLNLGPEGSERIPLAGSSAAIRPALAACWRTQR